MVNRAVAIASLPKTQLESDLTALEAQSDAMSGLDARFAALQTAVQGISDAMGGAAYQTEVSNEKLVHASLGDGAIEGVYSIEILDAGAYASAMTSSPWIPAGLHSFKIRIGSNTYDLNPANSTAGAVAAAINSKVGAQVRAVAVDVGPGTDQGYRISLQSTTLGPMDAEILDNGAALAQQKTDGRQAQYIVNGSGKTVTSDSRVVTIADGLSLTLLDKSPGNPVSITVTRSTSALSESLQKFASAYNDVVSALTAQQAQAGGALGGQSIVRTLQEAVSSISTYSADSGVSGLAGLGFDLGRNGLLTFNPLALMATDIRNPTGVTAFFGSRDAGFLKFATDVLDGVEDDIGGILKNAESSIKQQIKDTNGHIADQQALVDQLQQRLLEQMSAADAAIAAMQQQYNYVSTMFTAMRSASDQYK